MKALPAGLASALTSGVTTLCTCWKVTRGEEAPIGFTDHDRDLSFGGVIYQAASGVTASALASSLGLAVDTVEAHGALSSDAISETDLARGRWDNAAIEIYRVDWGNVANRVMILAGTIGEVSRGPLGFTAELRSLAHALNQATGRIYSTLCDADLGDARCGVNLAQPQFSDTGTVVNVIAQRSIFTASGLGFASGWCGRGLVTWTSGDNTAAKMEVKRHTIVGGNAVIELVQDMPFDIAAADTFAITAGCDKSIETCKAKFDNVVNFRGFPHMPGNDWVTSYPNQGQANDGGRLGS